MLSKDVLEKLLKFRAERDWEQFHTPKDLAMSVSIEAAELMQEFQWKSPAEISEHIRINKEKISDELADTLVYLLLLAHDLDIDVEKAILCKMEKNAAKYPVEKSRGCNRKYDEL